MGTTILTTRVDSTVTRALVVVLSQIEPSTFFSTRLPCIVSTLSRFHRSEMNLLTSAPLS